MRGWRMSALPVAQFCGKSAELGQRYGAGRGAAMGSAFHSRCADEPDADKLAASLSHEELEEIATWHRPSDVDLGDGVILTYADADKEGTLALDLDGEYCEPKDPRCVTVGHYDFAWVVTLDGMRTAYVADIKRSEWTTSEGAQSLQLLAYGVAYASKHNCDAFCVGIFAATEGEWQWGDIHEMLFDGPAVAERVVHAALNKEVSTGGHCSNCYVRLHCAEHLMPAEVAKHIKEFTMATDSAEPITTQAEALKHIRLAEAMETMAKAAKGHAREYARRYGGIEDGDAFYGMVESKGRKSFKGTQFAEKHPELYEEFSKRGPPTFGFRWLKTEAGKARAKEAAKLKAKEARAQKKAEKEAGSE